MHTGMTVNDLDLHSICGQAIPTLQQPPAGGGQPQLPVSLAADTLAGTHH